MPLTKLGKRVKNTMQDRYGAEKGKEVFYASLNKGTISRSKMEGKKKKKA